MSDKGISSIPNLIFAAWLLTGGALAAPALAQPPAPSQTRASVPISKSTIAIVKSLDFEQRNVVNNAIERKIEIISAVKTGFENSLKYSAAASPEKRGRIGLDIARQDLRLAAARDAIAVVNGREEVNPYSLIEVEEVIMSLTRPVWVLCAGTPWVGEDLEGWSSYVNTFISRYPNIVASVGRLEVSFIRNGRETHPQVIGTAFAVSDRLVLTNFHVIERFARRDGNRWRIYGDTVVRLNRGGEYHGCRSRSPDAKVRIAAVMDAGAATETEDWAVLKTEAAVGHHAVPAVAGISVSSGQRVAVIGYPGEPDYARSRMRQSDIDRVFKAPDGQDPQFKVKRISPGSLEEGSDLARSLAYNSNTAPVNSGSLVVRLSDGAVIGLHRGGFHATNTGEVSRNVAVGSARLAKVLETLNATANDTADVQSRR